MPANDFYIAGPMRGRDRFNFPAFDHAKDWLIRSGYTVISPADLDRQAGFDESKDSLEEFDMEAAAMRDVRGILDSRAIALLPGWQTSKGCAFEISLANFLGKDLFLIDSQNQTMTNVTIAIQKTSFAV